MTERRPTSTMSAIVPEGSEVSFVFDGHGIQRLDLGPLDDLPAGAAEARKRLKEMAAPVDLEALQRLHWALIRRNAHAPCPP